jgi:predicted transcriptional regulator
MTRQQKASKRHTILQRRLRVAELAAQGRTQLEIALELGVSQPTICADLNEIHAQWQKAAEVQTAERIAREIAMIEEIRRAAWQGWARSQQDEERKRVKTTAAPDQDSGVKVQRTKERRTRSGDSKMLQTALKCSEMILRTLGAFKTKPTPPVNTWDTVLKALYETQATGNGQSDAERIERRVKEMPAEGSPQRHKGHKGNTKEDRKTKKERIKHQAAQPRYACDGSPGWSTDAQPGGIAGDVASHGEEKKLGDGAAGAMARPDAKAAETPTSAAPVSDAEPGAQVPPGDTQTPKALGADDPDDCWLTARRGWIRVATVPSGWPPNGRFLSRWPP